MSGRSIRIRRARAQHASLVAVVLAAWAVALSGGFGAFTFGAAMLTGCMGMPDGTACDDGNACTTGESCRADNCVAPATLGQAAGSPVGVGTAPRAAGVGDWNRNGFADLAVANNTTNDVTILLGNGLGGFSAASGSPIAVGTNPRWVAVADLDGDHKLDLAVANQGSANVTILLGNGSGGFSAAAGSPVAVGTNPIFVAAADLTGDGVPDLAVANQGSANVTILLGSGSGGFSAAAGSPVAVGTNPTSVAAADLSGDGKADLAVTNAGSANVTILLGNGSGGFSAAAGSPISVGTNPQSIVAGDWDGDGETDLAVANNLSNNVSILLGNGAGGFSPASGSPIAVGSQSRSLAIGDLNVDGRPDLLVANTGANAVTVLLGSGTGGFSQPAGSPIAVGMGPQAVAVGDWNGDGRPDFCAANGSTNNVSIFLNNTTFAPDGTACNDDNPCTLGDACRSRTCLAPASFSGTQLVSGISTLTSGDWNHDGTVDLVTGGGCYLDVYLGTGGGAFTSGASIGGVCAPQDIAAVDLNSDGTLDFAEIAGNDQVQFQQGNGVGGFSPAGHLDVGNPVAMITGDWNGDGHVDLAVSRNVSGVTSIFLGNGLGAFSLYQHIDPWMSSMVTGDWNGDGKLDLAGTCDTGANGCYAVFLGNGDGSFSAAPGSYILVPPGMRPVAITTGDWNGDGRPDLATASFEASSVSILFGDGHGRFEIAQGPSPTVGSLPQGIGAGDFNGDGWVDLAVAVTDGVAILLGDGNGRFTNVGSFGPGTARLLVRDLSGDGKLDVAALLAPGVELLLDNRTSAPDGTSCNDANACTSSDQCLAGSCGGTPVPGPDEVGNNVLVTGSGSNSTISWSLATGATTSAVVRGLIGGLPVGPGNGDEVCLASGLPAATLSLDDSSLPATGASYWYLVRGDNMCGKGPYGFQAYAGVPTAPRVTTTCP